MVRLKNSALVSLYGINIQKDKVYIIMEYCPGGSLYNFLRSDKFLSIKQKIKILLDCVLGLHHLHTKNPPILHRDIKSLNILLKEIPSNENQQVYAKICDYGLARLLESDCTRTLMSPVGTPAWTAPEIIEGEKYRLSVDIYSFGIVIWEIFSGKIPYSYKKYNNMQIMNLVCNQDLRPNLEDLAGDMPSALKSLMQSCWNKDHGIRPKTIGIIEILNNINDKL